MQSHLDPFSPECFHLILFPPLTRTSSHLFSLSLVYNCIHFHFHLFTLVFTFTFTCLHMVSLSPNCLPPSQASNTCYCKKEGATEVRRRSMEIWSDMQNMIPLSLSFTFTWLPQSQLQHGRSSSNWQLRCDGGAWSSIWDNMQNVRRRRMDWKRIETTCEYLPPRTPAVWVARKSREIV